MSDLAYLDASALVKLIIAEEETPALQSDIIGRDGLVASRLSVLEARRAIARRPTAARIATLEEITNALVVIEMDARVVEAAASIQPPSLRSLDAIHLASALSLEPQLPHVITYDQRLAEASRANGLTVVQPGR